MNPLSKSAPSRPLDHSSVFAEFAACLMCLLGQLRAPEAARTQRHLRGSVLFGTLDEDDLPGDFDNAFGGDLFRLDDWC